jgi:hypothetical protein
MLQGILQPGDYYHEQIKMTLANNAMRLGLGVPGRSEPFRSFPGDDVSAKQLGLLTQEFQSTVRYVHVPVRFFTASMLELRRAVNSAGSSSGGEQVNLEVSTGLLSNISPLMETNQ